MKLSHDGLKSLPKFQMRGADKQKFTQFGASWKTVQLDKMFDAAKGSKAFNSSDDKYGLNRYYEIAS